MMALSSAPSQILAKKDGVSRLQRDGAKDVYHVQKLCRICNQPTLLAGPSRAAIEAAGRPMIGRGLR